jgi:non-specific protein-tyrosine kinase
MRRHQQEQQAQASSAPDETPTLSPDQPAQQRAGGTVSAACALQPAPAEAPQEQAPQRIYERDARYSLALVAHHDRGGQIAEQYRALRTSLLTLFHNQPFALLITSAEPDEGKTVTCANLGLVLAERPELSVAVVDCDLRKGRLHAMLGIAPEPGMADILKGTTTLDQIIQPTVYSNLSVIPAGKTAGEDVASLITRPELAKAIAELRRRFDCVLLDSPPVNPISDAAILGHLAGDALLVVRMNKTHRESVDRAVRLLDAANVKLAGALLTHQKYFLPKYIYRYS